MRWFSTNALVIALVLTLIAAGSSLVASQSGGTPAVGTPISGTPVGATPVVFPIGSGGLSYQRPTDLVRTLPAVIPGEVPIVATFPLTFGDDYVPKTMVLLRNDTAQPIANVSVAGSVHDESGSLTAAGANENTWPSVVQPGEVAHAYVEFQGSAPYGVYADYTVAWTAVADYSSDVPLTVPEANTIAQATIGFVQNPSSDTAYSGTVAGSCYDEAGVMTTWSFRALENSSVNPGQSVPFSLNLWGANCTSIVLTAGA